MEEEDDGRKRKNDLWRREFSQGIFKQLSNYLYSIFLSENGAYQIKRSLITSPYSRFARKRITGKLRLNPPSSSLLPLPSSLPPLQPSPLSSSFLPPLSLLPLPFSPPPTSLPPPKFYLIERSILSLHPKQLVSLLFSPLKRLFTFLIYNLETGQVLEKSYKLREFSEKVLFLDDLIKSGNLKEIGRRMIKFLKVRLLIGGLMMNKERKGF